MTTADHPTPTVHSLSYGESTATFIACGETVFVQRYGWAAMTRGEARKVYAQLLDEEGFEPCEPDTIILGTATIKAHTSRESFGDSARLDRDVEVPEQVAPILADFGGGGSRPNRYGHGSFMGCTILQATARDVNLDSDGRRCGTQPGRYVAHGRRYGYELARMICEGSVKLGPAAVNCTADVEDCDLSEVEAWELPYRPKQSHTFTYAPA